MTKGEKMMPKYINADEMMIDESAAYLAAQGKTHDEVTRLVNKAVHLKLQMLLCDAPSAVVQEVKRGEWIPISDGEWAECSECGEGCGVSENGGMAAFSLFQKIYKYCPNCGARMDGKECENDE